MTTLSDIKSDVMLKITSIEDCHFSRRLLEMNLLPGNFCKILYKAPFGGPLAVQVNDSFVLALRQDEAQIIRVTKV